MRRWILAGAIAALTLVLAGVAVANFTQVSKIALTTHTPGQSTGINASVRSSDPAAVGLKPKRATELVIAFPANTRFNLLSSMVSACTLSDKQLTTPFGPSCPSGGKIGSGSAVLNAMPIQPALDAQVKAYVHGANSIMIVLYPNQKVLPGSPPIIVHAGVSEPRLVIPLPHVVYGKGTGKFKSFPGVTAVIVSLKLNIGAIGSGHDALITAGSCTAHTFVVKSRFTYADRSTRELISRSRSSSG
jgi:hypothetical protein